AAARIRTCSAEINTRHRRARAKTVRPHIGRQAFALEDVSPSEAHFLFNIWRSPHLSIDHSGVHVATEASERSERQFLHLFTTTVPSACFKAIGHILCE